MTEQKLKELTEQLELTGSIVFIDKDFIYDIFISSNEYRYEINQYNLTDILYLDQVLDMTIKPFDGGICTGSAKDAIEFML